MAESTAGDWLIEATVEQLQKMMQQREATSRDIVLGYMERIATLDRGDGGIGAVLEVNPDAVHLAEAADAERAQTGPRGPLHGIPVLLKDNIDTGDRMHTSAGSIALAESYAREDAFLVGRLRRAGAVILGKANLTEWANFMTEGMPNGYSSRGGQVKNPYGAELDVGGSSSGSAAAVAANLAAIAVGTETSGSILNPSVRNGVVGIKPTVGLISRTGIIPIAWSQDTAGPIARTVREAAILLGVLAGSDERDPVTLTGAGRAPDDYTAFLDHGALRGKRIGIPRGRYSTRLSADEERLFTEALRQLTEAGATLVDPVRLDPPSAEWDSTVLYYEFKPALNAYLAKLDPRVPAHTLRELIAFNEDRAEQALRYGQTLFAAAEALSGTLTEPAYAHSRLRDLRISRIEGIDRVMREYRLDALFFAGSRGAGIAAKAGYPSIAVPAGFAASGEPFGVTFTAGAFSEPLLVGLAYAFEFRTRYRMPPHGQRHGRRADRSDIESGTSAMRVEERTTMALRPIVRIGQVDEWENFLASCRESVEDDMFTFYQRSHRGGLYGKYLKTLGEDGLVVKLPTGNEEVITFPIRVKQGRFYD